MKKLALVFGTAALLLAGCSQEESLPGEDSTPNAIAFGTFVQKPTKGTAVTGTSLPDYGQFLVMGYTSAEVVGAAIDFMRQTVTFNGSTYTYSPEKYWPGSGTVDFFAVYPADIDNGTAITPATMTLGLPKVSYTIPSTVTQQKDLMLASSLNKTSGDGTVNFAFGHVLTKIGFKAQLAASYDAYIQVQSIKVGSTTSGQGLAESVVYDAEGNTGTWSMSSPATTANASAFATQYSLSAENLVSYGYVTSTSTMTNILLDNSYLMVAPIKDCTNAGDVPVEVIYKVGYADGSFVTNTATGSIPKTNIAAAAAISVNMTITLSGVSFSSSVVDWVAGTDSSM